MRRLTLMALACALFTFIGCRLSPDERYQRYLEEMNDSSDVEFLTPKQDSVEYVEDDGFDPFADDGGLTAIPDIPKERKVNLHGSSRDVEKMMMGKE